MVKCLTTYESTRTAWTPKKVEAAWPAGSDGARVESNRRVTNDTFNEIFSLIFLEASPFCANSSKILPY